MNDVRTRLLDNWMGKTVTVKKKGQALPLKGRVVGGPTWGDPYFRVFIRQGHVLKCRTEEMTREE